MAHKTSKITYSLKKKKSVLFKFFTFASRLQFHGAFKFGKFYPGKSVDLRMTVGSHSTNSIYALDTFPAEN